MESKICTCCKQDKPIEEFARKLNRRQARCKQCFSLYTKEHYKKNKKYYRDRAIEFSKKRRPELIQFIVQYLRDHPCIDCGEKDPIVLEFDHVRGKKYKAISKMVADECSVQTIEKEIAKCEVRCANCHRRKTAKQFNYYNGIKM